ncbi:glutamine--tRNA ligase [Candidatus Pantoea edessiphila]|uniref:Glutamine--tRNA ligase n=1 Tax=Candidatus Pantoea edessiphila TaxID=2044610 RepID=A0A2P5SZ06_9GAMM|nr:glutamine--tRNA ligase [Candidatus Pantoea edessiphila]MBK4775293.1 glutamine--tRNA ligase [Pantoea sp. Edef]PPI87569.1 glutamine--tRNA ligase [Candidatus Pantoea edessiphila]
MKKNKHQSTNFIRQTIDKDISLGKYKKIHTRFPPEPNGYLHIGHAKAICLNFGIAKDYNGNCNLRFDDTNPVNENNCFVESIKQDISWLGFCWNGNVCYTSDYFDQIYQYAIELIKKGLAYVDELTMQEIKDYRGVWTKPGKNSPYRDRSVEENLLLFDNMRKGFFKEGEACLRAKIDMSSSFIVMRDPVLYRIKFFKHHQTKYDWCIYPMYDFAHCISDSLEGITHSLCTLEFLDNRRLYNWILKNISVSKRPNQYEYSRLNLEYSVLSKRKLNQLVNKNYVEGWDDPRMPTISGLRRRGYTPSSIREFCQRIGITKQQNLIEMSSLESCIRDDLNKNAPRAMAILDPIKLIIQNLPIYFEKNILMNNHPSKTELGNRTVKFSNQIWIERSDFLEQRTENFKRLILGNEVRLRNACIIRSDYITKDIKGNINCIYCTCDLNTLDNKHIYGYKIKNVGIIHWISILHAIPAEFRLYHNLFNIRNPEIEEDFLSNINLESIEIKNGYVEQNLQNAEATNPYQFERNGYFCADSIHSSKDHLVFNRIVSLRDPYKKSRC